MSVRRPSTANIIRWMTENGLEPVYRTLPGGHFEIVGKAANDSTDAPEINPIADKINQLGAAANGKSH